MLEKLLRRPAAVARRSAGILGPYVDSFLVAASELGYTKSTLRTQLWVLGDLERWLKRKRLVLVALEEQVLKQFLEHQRRHGRLRRGDSRTAQRLLEHLRAKGVVPSPEPAVDHSPLASLGQRDEDYLRKERALCPGTRARYWGFLRQFLVERFGRGPICLRKLVADDVSNFVLRHARSSPKTSDGGSVFRSVFRGAVGAHRERSGLGPRLSAQVLFVSWGGTFWGSALRRYRSVQTSASRFHSSAT